MAVKKRGGLGKGIENLIPSGKIDSNKSKDLKTRRDRRTENSK